MRKTTIFIFSLFLIVTTHFPAFAHVENHASIHDTVAGIMRRFINEIPLDQLQSLQEEEVLERLTSDERHVLGTEHISFVVNVPVTVTIARYKDQRIYPFWLRENGFKKIEDEFTVAGIRYETFQKHFEAGWIGLGIHSFTDEDEHYLVILSPYTETDRLEVTDLYPGQLKLATLQKGIRAYVDDSAEIETIPPQFKGHTFIQTFEDGGLDARLVGAYFETRHPSTAKPDQIVLTWSDDPKTTQTIQWRTSPEIKEGYVRYIKKTSYNQFSPKSPIQVKAETVPYPTLHITNDPLIHRYTVTLRDLEPGETYLYSVGDGSEQGWTELAEFTTAPDTVVPFSFIYMGDAQNGLYRWGSLVHKAFQSRPDAAFYVMAGDLVNRGNERWDWDAFFYNSSDIYDRRQLVPVIGNHECQGGNPSMYLDLFTLPHNGPQGIEPERAYAFEYSNALFVILDSNLPPESQSEWLDKQLSESQATWKFAVYHHPAYSSKPSRDNKEIRKQWGDLFDKYHVDMALQGHDHAYLRTYPMKDGKRTASPQEGTIYIVSISGIKFYDQALCDYTDFGMTNVSTYQVLDLQIEGDRLVYHAYDTDGVLRDEITIHKNPHERAIAATKVIAPNAILDKFQTTVEDNETYFSIELIEKTKDGENRRGNFVVHYDTGIIKSMNWPMLKHEIPQPVNDYIQSKLPKAKLEHAETIINNKIPAIQITVEKPNQSRQNLIFDMNGTFITTR